MLTKSSLCYFKNWINQSNRVWYTEIQQIEILLFFFLLTVYHKCVCVYVCMCVCAHKKPNLLKRYYHQRTICISLYSFFHLPWWSFSSSLSFYVGYLTKKERQGKWRKISRKKREEETPGGREETRENRRIWLSHSKRGKDTVTTGYEYNTHSEYTMLKYYHFLFAITDSKITESK